jgi:hypothetical protein
MDQIGKLLEVEEDQQTVAQPVQGPRVTPVPQPEVSRPNPPASLEQALARFESMPREVQELKRALGEVLHKFQDALDHLGLESKRLSTEASALALMADRLQARLSDLERAMSGAPAYRTDAGQPVDVEPEPSEPQFRPSDQGVGVVLAGVPGFQGLMDVQRALSNLPESEGASVVAYRNGEASLQLVLNHPVSARSIIEGLERATGEQLLIEESRPEAQRLRLRFVEGEGRR